MNLDFLAQRIREFRKKRGFTLEQLAERSQLTQSVLSKVENSRVTPSLVALSRIADALGTTLSELMKGVDDERKILVVSAKEREAAERNHSPSGMIYRPLAPTSRDKRMGPYVIEVPPEDGAGAEAWSREGEAFIMVLKGLVELDYGDERYRLRKGDCVYLDAAEKHRILNPGDRVAEILWVFSGDHSAKMEPEF